MPSFASRLRDHRCKAGYTQKQIASELGLAWRTWQDYETGKRTPTFEGLIALADFFDVPVEFLIGRLDPDLCTIVERIAARESRSTQEQMELFLRKAAESFMEANDLAFRPDIDDVGTDEEYNDYIMDILGSVDTADVPREPEDY